MRVLHLVLSIVFILFANLTHAEVVTVPFNQGFVGYVGNNNQEADTVITFSDLGFDATFFSQVSSTGQFQGSGAQGNDVAGTLRLRRGSELYDIPGRIGWQLKEQGQVKLFGFLPNTGMTPIALTVPSGFTMPAGIMMRDVANANPSGDIYTTIGGEAVYYMTEYSNYGVTKFGTALADVKPTTSDARGIDTGEDVSGSADGSGILDALNSYLATASSSRPLGPVTVTSQTTADTTPTVTGAVTLQSGEYLALLINGKFYLAADGVSHPADNGVSGAWSLTIPAADALSVGQTYDVSAMIFNTAGWLLEDSTINELVITNGVTPAPQLTVTKTVDETALADGAAAGDVLSYTVSVANTGNVTLYDLTWTDTLTDGDSTTTNPAMGTPVKTGSGASGTDGAVLEVGDTLTFTISHTVTQAQLDSGSLSNLASFTALTTDGDTGTAFTVESTSTGNTTTGAGNGTATGTSFSQTPEMTVTKTVDETALADGAAAGDVLSYTVSVANTGNVTLYDLSWTDTLTDGDSTTTNPTMGTPVKTGSGASGIDGAVLEVGDTLTFTISHTVTQAQLDSGSLSNLASFTALTTDGDTGTAFTVESTSTGNTSTGAGNGTATGTSFSQTLQLTVTKTVDETALADGATAGDILSYTVSVANTGNVTLYDLTWTDTLTDGDSTTTNPAMGTPVKTGSGASGTDGAVLEVGDTLTFTISHTVTQAQLDSGSLSNLASFTALTTDGDAGTAFTVESSSTGNTTTGAGNGTATGTSLTADASVALTKTDQLNMAGSSAAVGDTISYSFTVTNTGNVTLTNLTLTDANATVSGGPIAALAPGASDTTTFTAVHTITQADLDAGSVSNSATITGSSPSGTNDVSDTSSASGTGDTPTVTSLPTVPELTVTKTVSSNDVDSSGTLTAGDILTYTVVATNSGSVTVSDLSLSDDFTRADSTVLSASLGTPVFSSGASAATFPSGATATVTMTHTVTQADIDAGGLSNSATATAWVDGDSNSTRAGDGSEDVTDTTDTAVTNSVTRAGGITLVKTATLGSGTPVAGDTVTYAFIVTNTGNVTLTNVVLTDAGVTLTGGPIASLLPGASDSTTYTASYVLTQSDINSGSISNSASVTASTPMGTQVTDTSGTDASNDTATVTALTQAADIAIAKSVSHTDTDQSGTVTLGDTLTYTITVTNSGNTTLRDVAITEDFRRSDNTVLTATLPAASFSSGSSAAMMLPGGAATTSFAHVVTQADVDAGGVTNLATATAWSDDDGNGMKATNGSETVSDTLSQPLTTAISGGAGIALKKSGALQDIDGTLGTSLGDKIVYTLEVKNTGSVTLTNVTLNDPLFGGTVPQTITSLAPGQTDSLTFVLDYMITTADLDTGSVSNLASVTATAGSGSVSDQSGPTFDTDEAIVTFLGSIGGHVTDGTRGKSGVTVILYDESTGQEVARATTDSTGLYTFLELEQGTYQIRFVPPGDAAVQSRSERGNPQGEMVQNIEVAAGADRVITQVDALVVDPSGVIYDAITRQPIQDATVTLLINGSEVPNSWLDTTAGDSNNKVTGADGRYSFLLQSPAQSGTYSLRVSHADYSFVSDIIPPQSGTYTPALGLGVEEIVASSDLPSASGGDETYYLNFGFTFGDWTDSATLSKGIVHNHIPMDPAGYTTGLRVTKTADTSGLSSFPEVGEVITYAITVQNLGQLDYGTVSLDDPLTNDEALVTEVGVTDDGILGAGEIWRYTASYTLTAADLRRGEVSNLATLQATLLAGSTATSGAAPTGSDIGGVHIYESRATGNTLRGTGNGEATVVTITPDMIAMIEDDLTDILKDDVRVTMQRQSAQISGYSADALEWLKASLSFGDDDVVAVAVPCGSNSDPLSGKVKASVGNLDLETDWQRELCNPDTGVRVVDQLSLNLTHDDDLGTQHLLTFAHRKERLHMGDRVSGNFIGGYLSQTAVTDKADGTISGMGVNGGFYGAGRVLDEMFYSYHLAGVVGRHSYDLDFERDRTINATGDFTYFGLFAGASLAGDLSFGDTIVTPRAGIDFFHAPDTKTDVTATSGPFSQSANLSVEGVTGNRTFLEVRLANDPNKAFDGEGMWDGLGGELSLTLRGFCDSYDGLDSRCGAGGSVTYDKMNPDTGRAVGFELDAETTEQTTALRGSLAFTRHFAKGQGTSVFAMHAGSTGEPELSYQLNLAF